MDVAMGFGELCGISALAKQEACMLSGEEKE